MADPAQGQFEKVDSVERIVQDIRDLLNKANTSKYEYPSTASLVFDHPSWMSAAAYQLKTAPHYQQDMRRAEFLDGVAKTVDDFNRGQPRQGALGKTEYVPTHDRHILSEAMGRIEDTTPDLPSLVTGRAGTPIPGLQEAIEKRDTLRGPYWNRGYLAYGQPLRNGFDFTTAFASTNINAGKMLGAGLGLHGQTKKESAELADQAAEDFANSADRLLLNIPSALGGIVSPMPAAWEAERAAEETRPVADMSFAIDAKDGARINPRLMSLPYEQHALSGLKQGTELTDPIMGPGLASTLAGMAIDIATDPVSEVVPAIRALSKGAIRRGLTGLASEAALPASMIGVSESLKRAAEEEIRRKSR